MHNIDGVTPRDQYRALGLSTLAFTVCFAVWTIFSIIGVKIKQDLGLTETQFGLLVATPILTGSLSRIFLGVWTDQFGGRIMLPLQMLITAISVWLLASVQTYAVFLMIALGLGLAGGRSLSASPMCRAGSKRNGRARRWAFSEPVTWVPRLPTLPHRS